MRTQEEIRNSLSLTLKDDPTNYSRILDLSNELAGFDTENVRFSVDAGVIDRLGRELVARQETAVSELIKNSYDADAKQVILTFENSGEVGGTLTIEDDGTGMTREELISGFMRISSTSKVHDPFSQLFRRKRAGSKGIGRFSVQRLGGQLTIITQTEDSQSASKLIINWDQYSRDTALFSIKNKIEQGPKTRPKGTTITISNLRDNWTLPAIKRIYRYVSAIIQPFSLSSERTKSEKARVKNTSDPGFKINIIKREGKKNTVVANEDLMIFRYAAAEIEGYINEEGMGVYHVKNTNYKIKRKGLIGKDKSDKVPFEHIKHIYFKAYYFIHHEDFIPSQQRASIQEFLAQVGGIRLYRNGFRVLPYGEPYFDWLKLDESVRKRVILPVHGNDNFYGFVEVTETTGLLEETSSREGLQENEAFQELQNFLYRTLILGVIEIASHRNVKITTNQKNWQKKFDRPKSRLSTLAQVVKQQASEISKSDPTTDSQNAAKALTEAADALTEAIREQEEDEKKLIEELGMMRVLSSLGLTIGQFTHEIRHYLLTLQASVKKLQKATKNDISLQTELADLFANIQKVKIYSSYFDTAVSANVNREIAPIEIRDVINEFVKVISPDLERSNIALEPLMIEGLDLFTTPMHMSEWSSILFNLYTNSKKAIIKANKGSAKIFIRGGHIADKIFLEFSDNGIGIDDTIKNRVFDAFFTTYSPTGHFASIEEELIGSGLGLKIVRDMLISYRGSINVIQPSPGFSTTFRIEIPKATKEDLETYDSQISLS